ncbi:MAG: hypothetical protein KatS3mg023_3803 [Armatimonadota bacterium]|nr:MAG: hypothetical protein KatS3mg023_3803 [Armatimonadota bacterium]
MNPMAKARGLQLGRLARRVRLHDGSPARNIASSDGISRPSEAAADTPEMRLRRTVGFCHMPAGGAGPGGVPGIDKDHRNACQTSLILDEGAKLMERPTVLDATLSLLNREPFADALEVFRGDAATGAFGLRDQLLADDVDGHLSRQAKPFPDVVVDEFLEPDLVGRLLPEGDFGNSVTRRVEPLHRLQKGGGLLGRRLKLDHQRQVHVLIITRNPQSRKCGSRPSSPRLKAGASGRRSL